MKIIEWEVYLRGSDALFKKWFVEHLQTTDYRYVKFFKGVGVSKLP
ncbi:MAG: hypothetical protein KKE83_07440 [Proteobacteria bacterium]|nr:hypothetical protein [Pseudomonadota bacterium]MBU1546803.1 hypothetical protein [Pseudomonadota bacterium]MBU2619503.1 hypothetical protein [Pseudomonadota bacterium]